jgi:hypothetical protein
MPCADSMELNRSFPSGNMFRVHLTCQWHRSQPYPRPTEEECAGSLLMNLLQDEWRWCSVSTAQQQKNVLYCVVQCALLHKKAESNILLQFYLAATLYKLLITTTSIVLNVKCGGFIQINLSSNAALAVCDRLWNSVMLGCPVAPGDSGLLCVSVWRAIFFNRIYLNRNSLRWNFLSCFPTPVVPCISWGT